MKTLPPEIVLLQETYQKAQLNLISILASQEAKGNVTTYTKAIMASVNEELATLNKFTTKWISGEIPAAYKGGINEALKTFRQANIDIPKIAANQRALKNIIDNMAGQLQDANNFVGRRIADTIREAGVEAIAQKMSVGATVAQTKANLMAKLADKGVAAITDKNGRAINMDAYASMVARTTSREATNKGSMQAVKDIGYDLVQITSTFSTCPLCATYEGRIYSISGKDKRYPPLDAAFSGGYSTIHPNCTHSAVPYFEEFDDDADKNRADSNKPFEVTAKDKASIDAYNKDQKVKADRRSDRTEWEQAKLVAPSQTPKTFSGFRAAKRADNERYKLLQEKIGAAKAITIPATKENVQSLLRNPKAMTRPKSFGPRDEFEDALQEFTAGSSGYSEITTAILKGEKLEDSAKQIRLAQQMLNEVASAPKLLQTILRIEELGANPDIEIVVGEKFTLGLRSFSRNDSLIREILSGASDVDVESPVIFKLANARSINLAPYSPYFTEQMESATAGQFRIIKIVEEKIEGQLVKVVTIEQI